MLCIAARNLFAAIDGTVVNQTTGKPQAGVTITLVKPGRKECEPSATRSATPPAISSSKTISRAAVRNCCRQLQRRQLQQADDAEYPDLRCRARCLRVDEIARRRAHRAAHAGARAIAPARSPSTKPSRFRTTRTQPINNQRSVASLLSAACRQRPGADQCAGSQGMPLPRPAEKTEENDVFKINFPIKPGETEFKSPMFSAGSPFTFRGARREHQRNAARPAASGCSLRRDAAGKDIQKLGTEPKTQATIYNVTASKFFA